MSTTKKTVAIIVGSLRKESCNLKLAKAIAKLAENHFATHFVTIADLPLYNQDLESAFPAPALRTKKEIQSADAILFVTPEYNRGIPGVLKNAIDWASRPYGQSAFDQKPVAICSASPGAIGGACSQQQLKTILVYLNTRLLGQPEIYFQFKENAIDAAGNIQDNKTQQFLQSFVDQFSAWISR